MKKHVSLSYMYLHDSLPHVLYIPTKHNFADILTKDVDVNTLRFLTSEIFDIDKSTTPYTEPDKPWPTSEEDFSGDPYEGAAAPKVKVKKVARKKVLSKPTIVHEELAKILEKGEIW